MPRAVRSNDGTPRDDVFKALADGTRRAIITRIGTGEARVTDIAAGLRVSRPAVSKHLRLLLAAGLVDVEQRGRERWYRISKDALRDVVGYIEDVEAFWGEGMARLDARLRRQKHKKSHGSA